MKESAMRPARLELEGFTSFRQRTVVDFSPLHLFAITGPTGAGKTSLIDSILFALYGRTPRISRGLSDLISQGSAEMKILFEFRAGGTQYRAFRQVKRKGAGKQRLDRRDGDDWETIADKSGAIDAKIRELIGLDYDGFTKTVVLPQGEFDKFLRGEASKRREILIELLGLEIYARMMQKANQSANQLADKSKVLEDHVARQLAGLSSQSVAELEGRLASAQGSVAQAQTELDRINAAYPLQQRIKELKQLVVERQSTFAQIAPIETLRKELAAALQNTFAQAQSAEEDAAAARRRADDLESAGSADLLRKQAQDLVKASARRAEIQEQREMLAKLAQNFGALKSGADDAAAAVAQAQLIVEQAIQESSAQELRMHLHAGDECPVCEQMVLLVPQSKPNATVQAAREMLAHAKKAHDAAQSQFHARTTQIRSLEAQIKTGTAALPELEEQDPQLLLQRASEVEAARLEAKKSEAQAIATRKLAEQAKDKLTQSDTALKLLRQKLEALQQRVTAAEAGETVEELERQLGELSQRDLESERKRLQAEIHTNLKLAAETEAAIERTNSLLRESEEKHAEIRELQRKSELSRKLGGHLEQNRFQTFVLAQTIRRLATEGTKQLKHLSMGRYSFATEGDEFLVVDHWNGDEQRSVNTLSGGESFLASLSLALALSRSLPDFATNRESIQLDSLFLDEGFSTLDTETMQIVLDAIELLQADGRMIGVVSHVSELAERLPARIEVSKSPGGSTVTIR
jgi:DNA repair protein SbcC/Rad50